MLPIKTNSVRVSSPYGNRQYYYQGKLVKDFHTGIDLVPIGCTGNEEILAFEDGIVTGVQKTGQQYGTACFVRIKHDNGMYTLYYHLKSNSIVVNVGERVTRGQKLGIIGTTGVSTGIHLHFQIDYGNSNNSINPYDYVFNGKEIINHDSYQAGNYVTLYNMYVRAGAGTTYRIKKVSELSEDGKRHATSTNPNAYAVYKKGTVYTARQIINQNGIWALTPSGYVCIKGVSGTVYGKKC